MAALKRYDTETDGFIECTEENSSDWLSAVIMNGSRQHKKLRIISYIANLHIKDDAGEIDSLYNMIDAKTQNKAN